MKAGVRRRRREGKGGGGGGSTGLFQMSDEESGDFLWVCVQARIAAHNFGTVDASDVKVASASLRQAAVRKAAARKAPVIIAE
jgi:hypothetical protein